MSKFKVYIDHQWIPGDHTSVSAGMEVCKEADTLEEAREIALKGYFDGLNDIRIFEDGKYTTYGTPLRIGYLAYGKFKDLKAELDALKERIADLESQL